MLIINKMNNVSETGRSTSNWSTLVVRMSNSALYFCVDSLYFFASVVKICTCDSKRSRSSLTWYSSTLRKATSFTKASFCFIASSWEAYKHQIQFHYNIIKATIKITIEVRRNEEFHSLTWNYWGDLLIYWGSKVRTFTYKKQLP